MPNSGAPQIEALRADVAACEREVTDVETLLERARVEVQRLCAAVSPSSTLMLTHVWGGAAVCCQIHKHVDTSSCDSAALQQLLPHLSLSA